MLKATEYQDEGVFNRVVEPNKLDEVTDDLAAEIASKSPYAVRKIKKAFRYGDGKSVRESADYRSLLEYQCYGHPDFVESVEAFKQNRAPDYTRK